MVLSPALFQLQSNLNSFEQDRDMRPPEKDDGIYNQNARASPGSQLLQGRIASRGPRVVCTLK